LGWLHGYPSFLFGGIFTMESYLLITQLNDFMFCPRSIYFHNIYQENYGEETYHQTPQKIGQTAHKAVDEGTYSTRKDILQGLTVYSEKYTKMFLKDILEHKEKIFLYIQSYYRWFMKDKPLSEFPCFKINEE
jgi:hypothetical protein